MVAPDQEFTFVLTANECNVVFGALQEMPYRISAPLIDKLRKQISENAPNAFSPEEQTQGNGLDKRVSVANAIP